MVQIINSDEVQQLQKSIEAIRADLHRLVNDGADRVQIIALSQHLDKLISRLMSSQFDDVIVKLRNHDK